jgi:hypothetical protein
MVEASHRTTEGKLIRETPLPQEALHVMYAEGQSVPQNEAPAAMVPQGSEPGRRKGAELEGDVREHPLTCLAGRARAEQLLIILQVLHEFREVFAF